MASGTVSSIGPSMRERGLAAESPNFGELLDREMPCKDTTAEKLQFAWKLLSLTEKEPEKPLKERIAEVEKSLSSTSPGRAKIYRCAATVLSMRLSPEGPLIEAMCDALNIDRYRLEAHSDRESILSRYTDLLAPASRSFHYTLDNSKTIQQRSLLQDIIDVFSATIQYTMDPNAPSIHIEPSGILQSMPEGRRRIPREQFPGLQPFDARVTDEEVKAASTLIERAMTAHAQGNTAIIEKKRGEPLGKTLSVWLAAVIQEAIWLDPSIDKEPLPKGWNGNCLRFVLEATGLSPLLGNVDPTESLVLYSAPENIFEANGFKATDRPRPGDLVVYKCPMRQLTLDRPLIRDARGNLTLKEIDANQAKAEVIFIWLTLKVGKDRATELLTGPMTDLFEHLKKNGFYEDVLPYHYGVIQADGRVRSVPGMLSPQIETQTLESVVQPHTQVVFYRPPAKP